MADSDIISCPYDISHMIIRSRMAAHLIKCRKQHISEKYITCPYNSTHDVPYPELQYHVENCMDRRKLDSFVYVPDETKEELNSLTKVAVPDGGENWDEETAEGSYLDIKNKVLEKEPVFRLPVGMTKSKRKAFFQHETSKFQKEPRGREKRVLSDDSEDSETECCSSRRGKPKSDKIKYFH